MSYKVKQIITTIITGALVLAAYCIYAFGQVQSGAASEGDLRFWATTMLVFIGIGVVATIIIQIVFHILLSISIAVTETVRTGKPAADKEIERAINVELVEDERDKLIELKAMRFGFLLAGLGFVAALFSLALGYSPAVMLNILFISFSAGSLLEGFAQLVLHYRG